MKRTLRVLFLFALAVAVLAPYLVLSGPSAEAASLPGTATVSGTVQAAQPFNAAQVYFRLPAKRMLYMVYTVGGHYQAMQLFPGDYEVSVKAKGLVSDVTKLTLTAGQKATMDLSMHPPSAAERTRDITYVSYDELYPPGPGKAVAERTCIYCHGENFLPTHQFSEAQWNGALDYMTGKGNPQGAMIRPSEMTPQDRQDVLQYLVANFGPGSKLRAVKLTTDQPVDEANLVHAEYIEYYFNVDPPGQGVNDPQYNQGAGSGEEGPIIGHRMGQDEQLDQNGNVWVTDRGEPTRLVKLDPRTGIYKDYLMPNPKAALHDMNIDKFGMIWVPENQGVPASDPKLWEFNPKTEKWTTSYAFDPQKVIADTTLKHPHSIAFDSKSNIYVGYILGSALSMWNRETKKMSTYVIPTENSFPYGVVTDKYDNVWIAEFHGSKIAKFDPQTKKFTEYQPPTHPALIRRLIVGSDGVTIWSGLFSAGKVEKLDPATGKFTEYTIPQQISQPYDFVPEGKYIWFSDAGQGGTIIRFDTVKETFAFFPAPQTADMPKIRLTKEGAIWYSPRSSRNWPGLGVLYPDITKITTLAAYPAPRPW